MIEHVYVVYWEKEKENPKPQNPSTLNYELLEITNTQLESSDSSILPSRISRIWSTERGFWYTLDIPTSLALFLVSMLT